jgi:hypothetical protein
VTSLPQSDSQRREGENTTLKFELFVKLLSMATVVRIEEEEQQRQSLTKPQRVEGC